jgi:hypothetical protein
METRWPPFLVTRGDTRLLQLAGGDGAGDVVAEWPLDLAFNNLRVNAVGWYQRAKAPARRADVCTGNEIRQWVDLTRSLARRMPLRRALREHLERTSKLVERELVWPELKVPAPPMGTKADAELRCRANLWAIDQLARAVRTGGTLCELWEALFGDELRQDLEIPFAKYKEADKRIRNFSSKLLPDMADTLMSGVLRVAVFEGYFPPHPATPPQNN